MGRATPQRPLRRDTFYFKQIHKRFVRPLSVTVPTWNTLQNVTYQDPSNGVLLQLLPMNDNVSFQRACLDSTELLLMN